MGSVTFILTTTTVEPTGSIVIKHEIISAIADTRRWQLSTGYYKT
jgi:hypothetical protein